MKAAFWPAVRGAGGVCRCLVLTQRRGLRGAPGVHLCRVYNKTEVDFVNQWRAFAVNESLPSIIPTMTDIERLRTDVRMAGAVV